MLSESSRVLYRIGMNVGLQVLFFVAATSWACAEHPSPVPSWACKAVWYQIFPERFRNGDTTNDPTVEDLRGSWPHESPKEWKISPWTSDWYKLQPWEEADGKGFYFQAQQRRYGGDLKGIIDKLDYLKQLGVTALYLNPVFQSPSLHKYDASTFHHIDKNFGPDPAGDSRMVVTEDPENPDTWKWTAADRLFLKLVREVHKRHMKIIIDGVFHCTGSTFWAFEDLKRNQRRSAFKDWYIVKQWDDPVTPEDEFDYEGWMGVRELPELKEKDSSLTEGPRNYIEAVVKRWMDPDADGNPEDGIDGWRLDAAEMAPSGFWREFRFWVKSINPQAYLTAELWWQDWKNDKMFNASPWLQGDEFDAVMNYRWAREVMRFFIGETTGVGVVEFDKRLRSLRNDYTSQVDLVLMNLVDSHDTDRLGSMVVNADSRYDHNVGVYDNRGYKVRKPTREEIRTQKLIALFQMTYPGAPMIYYGDESGMWGADDPDCRKPMLWDDMKYDDESHHPFGQQRPSDKNEFNADLFNWYKDLIEIRNSHAALSQGSFSTVLADERLGVYAFLRSDSTENVLVVVNNSATTQKVHLDVSLLPQLKDQWINLLDKQTYKVTKGTLQAAIAPKSGMILEGRGQQ